MNKPLQIHQFTSSISFGDASSNHIVDTAKILNNAGYTSKIFAEYLPSADFGHRVFPLSDYEKETSSDSILFVHFTLAFSEQVISWLKRQSSKTVLIYHNITPHTYFYGINQGLFDSAKLGRRQLRQLAGFMDVAIGVSDYNCDELRENGWETVYQLPISFDTSRLDAKPSSKVIKWGQEQDRVNILFVGRMAPNKKFEDLLLTFYHIKNRVLPNARLILVGSDRGMEPYADYVRAIIEQLQLEDVYITGHVSMSELVAYYQIASVYLSMSEHEGFGVPFLESVYFDVPIIAYNASAIPETLDGRGILFTEKRHESIAELVGLLVEDKKLRSTIVQNQQKILNKFSYSSFREKLLTVLAKIAPASEVSTAPDYT